MNVGTLRRFLHVPPKNSLLAVVAALARSAARRAVATTDAFSCPPVLNKLPHDKKNTSGNNQQNQSRPAVLQEEFFHLAPPSKLRRSTVHIHESVYTETCPSFRYGFFLKTIYTIKTTDITAQTSPIRLAAVAVYVPLRTIPN